jgi:thioredoxin-related protein
MKKIFLLLLSSLSLTAIEFRISNTSTDNITVFFDFSNINESGDYVDVPYEIAKQSYTFKPGERRKIKPKTSLSGKNYTIESISAATSKLVRASYPITEDKKNKNLDVAISIKTLPTFAGSQEVKEMPHFVVYAHNETKS